METVQQNAESPQWSTVQLIAQLAEFVAAHSKLSVGKIVPTKPRSTSKAVVSLLKKQGNE